MEKFGSITKTRSGHLRQTIKSGGKLIHRLIMEEYLGRKLLRSEIIHHIDGNPSNNDINNLKVMTQSQHLSLHKTGVRIYRNGNSSKFRMCPKCRKRFPLTSEYFSPKPGSPFGLHYTCKKCRVIKQREYRNKKR